MGVELIENKYGFQKLVKETQISKFDIYLLSLFSGLPLLLFFSSIPDAQVFFTFTGIVIGNFLVLIYFKYFNFETKSILKSINYDNDLCEIILRKRLKRYEKNPIIQKFEKELIKKTKELLAQLRHQNQKDNNELSRETFEERVVYLFNLIHGSKKKMLFCLLVFFSFLPITIKLFDASILVSVIIFIVNFFVLRELSSCLYYRYIYQKYLKDINLALKKIENIINYQYGSKTGFKLSYSRLLLMEQLRSAICSLKSLN